MPLALVPVLVYLALWLMVGYSLSAAGCGGARPAQLLLGSRPGSAGSVGSAGAAGSAGAPAVEVLVESNRFAPPPAAAGNRFDTGWEVRQLGDREALLPASGTGRLLAVHLGEEEPRTLILDLAREGLLEGERVSVRTGDRELAQATLHAGALPLRMRLPEDLPVGLVPLDLVFAAAGEPGHDAASGNELGQGQGQGRIQASSPGEAPRPAQGAVPGPIEGPGRGAAQPATSSTSQGAARQSAPLPANRGAGAAASRVRPGVPVLYGEGAARHSALLPGDGGTGAPASRARLGTPALYGAGLAPALPTGVARVEGADVVMAGNCLVYLRCQLAGQEALVGTFVPPAAVRPGQRFELSVELPDGTPIRRFSWRPSFWNRLRGARRFELPLRGTRGSVRVRLLSRAGEASGAGDAGGARSAVAAFRQAGRWQALGLVNVTGEILTPGQGQ